MFSEHLSLMAELLVTTKRITESCHNHLVTIHLNTIRNSTVMPKKYKNIFNNFFTKMPYNPYDTDKQKLDID